MESALAEPFSSRDMNASPVKVKHRRKRVGCLCCRLRKKKCDEVKPTCEGCERNFLICTWPLPNKKSGNGSNRDGVERITCPDAQTASQCDAIFSTIAEPTTILEDRSHAITSPAETRALLSVRSPPVIFVSPALQMLCEFYLRKTANTISILHDEVNPFITHIMPMAASDDLIMQGVAALSGAHLCKQSDASADVKTLAPTHEILVIRGLKFGLTRYRKNPENALSLIVAILFLCLTETVKGETNSNTLHHLKAARALILQWITIAAVKHDTGLRTLITELYLYLAILLSVPLGRDPYHQLVYEDSKLLFSYLPRDHTGPLFGCARDLFELIPQIFQLANEKQAAHDTSHSQFRSKEAAIASLLQEILVWKPTKDVHDDTSRGGKIYQQALIILHYTSFAIFVRAPVDILRVIDEALSIAGNELNHIPLDSPILTTLTWPLAVLGSCATRPEHQDLLRQRITGMCQTLRMTCFEQLLQVLETLWASSRHQNGMAAFEVVMKEMNLVVLTV
ncbi:hypothetical protein BU16DRAFT_565403 [Lophium mytilinum]|uniref:Zn(2)-C6 fungal-type domain-containing protein n=1 Tax=Lophium mytilinum TaxID=390894 RepID=A0A6A6QI34_9PEZI|nr:hypothetical protein BU16DRAFT_565403 [Lophium mytilinum]